jgi:DNA invertase Pin-like site-specific DNA recombinase
MQTKNEKLVGYARVSTTDQFLERQIDTLTKYECDYIVEEKESGVKERPMLNDLLGRLGIGDVLVVVEFSRISRSLKDLINIMEYLEERQIYFISIKENIDTRLGNGAFSKLIVNLMGSIYQFEKELSKERQAEGIKIARKNNEKYKGRKPKWHLDGPAAQHIFELVDSGKHTYKDIMEKANIPQATLYRIIRERKEMLEAQDNGVII